MKKIWVTIVTYNNSQRLNENVEGLLASDLVTSGKYDWYIEAINNHSNFYLRPEFEKMVKVHHNTVRPDWAYEGFLSRDYNSALIRGFKNLKAPINDCVIILQDDVVVKPNFMEKLEAARNLGIVFVMSGNGDSFNAFFPEAVRKVGLYDERFSSGFHEGDYALRAIQKLGTKCSIGDFGHGRVWNNIDNGKFYTSHTQIDRFEQGRASKPDASDPGNTTRAESDFVTSPPFTQQQMENIWKRCGVIWHEPFFRLKWGEYKFYDWSEDFMKNVIPTLKERIPNHVYYSYFEKDIEGIYDEVYHDYIPEIPPGYIVERPLRCRITYHGPYPTHDHDWEKDTP